MTIKGLIFDFDGLIVDTETPDYVSWEEMFQSYQAHMPFELWLSYTGMYWNIPELLDKLEEAAGRKLDRDAVWQHKEALYKQKVQEQLARPGVEAYLDAAAKMGLRTAIASSSDWMWISEHLGRVGLVERFETICTADDVERVKPHPDLFLLAAGRLGLPPAETIVFEDTLNGIRAAKAAGCHAVAVPNEATRSLDFSEADLVIPSMAEMPLEELVERFNHNLLQD